MTTVGSAGAWRIEKFLAWASALPIATLKVTRARSSFSESTVP